jgi:hypothetical protein
LIDELVHGDQLFVWTKPRQGTKPEVFLARVAQPVDANGQKIFTEIITAILPHENAREDDTERSSHLHTPLGCVKIDREHREHPDRVASLSVGEINAREDQPCEVILPKPPACLQNASQDAPKLTQSFLAERTACPMPARQLPPRVPIEAVLIKLGEILTKDELHVPRMNMQAVAKACQKHRGRIAKVALGYLFNARRMEEDTLNFFDNHRLIVTDKVKVECRLEPKEREHRNDKNYELQLSFHKFDRANDSYHLATATASTN